MAKRKGTIQLRTIGYARVSTLKQSDGWGIEAQLSRLDLYAKPLPWGYDDIIIDDGISTRRQRPGLEMIRAGIRDGSIRRLVIVKLDRLGRSMRELVDISGEIMRTGCELVSITENIDTGTSTGRFLFYVLAAVAELERDMISERTRAGMDAARAGGIVMGRPRLIPEDVERSIHALRAEGKSYPQICRALESAAIAPPNGLRWYPSTVARTCKRPSPSFPRPVAGIGEPRPMTGRGKPE